MPMWVQFQPLLICKGKTCFDQDFQIKSYELSFIAALRTTLLSFPWILLLEHWIILFCISDFYIYAASTDTKNQRRVCVLYLVMADCNLSALVISQERWAKSMARTLPFHANNRPHHCCYSAWISFSFCLWSLLLQPYLSQFF